MNDERDAATAGDVAAQADATLRALEKLGRFTGAALLARGDVVVHRGAYGQANREYGAPNTPETKFRIGSITKQFTAVAILMLKEEGKLDVSDPISRHLPYSPEAWSDITVHMLLNHTSGIANLTSLPRSQETSARLPLSLREVVETFRESPLEFRSGMEFRYCNSGYILLGDIIERASGMTYEAFLREHIFGPLGMNDSGYDRNGAILPNRASGYRKRNGEWENASYIDMGYPSAAGALYSTVDDLFLWHQALGAGRLVSAESHTRMTTVTPLLSTYGYGVSMGRAHNRRTVHHAGGINGFRANLVRYPDEAACVIVLCNSETTDHSSISATLGAILFGEKYEAPSQTRHVIAPDTMAQYAGDYEILPGVTLQISAHVDRLIVRCGNARGEFLPESDTVFGCEENTNGLTFPVGEDSGIRHLVLREGGVETEARRVAAREDGTI
jgi:CubicO group peptidase (beta-lactamase class C family)